MSSSTTSATDVEQEKNILQSAAVICVGPVTVNNLQPLGAHFPVHGGAEVGSRRCLDGGDVSERRLNNERIFMEAEKPEVQQMVSDPGCLASHGVFFIPAHQQSSAGNGDARELINSRHAASSMRI